LQTRTWDVKNSSKEAASTLAILTSTFKGLERCQESASKVEREEHGEGGWVAYKKEPSRDVSDYMVTAQMEVFFQDHI
jgi:hypothetical protein